jgi:hypothetical protein
MRFRPFPDVTVPRQSSRRCEVQHVSLLPALSSEGGLPAGRRPSSVSTLSRDMAAVTSVPALAVGRP